MLSTPVLEAASISTTSSSEPSRIARQASQVVHGSGVIPFSQLSALARIRAVVVFPVPLGPQNKYAWAGFPADSAFRSVRQMWSCPMTSSKVWGRYFRYSD